LISWATRTGRDRFGLVDGVPLPSILHLKFYHDKIIDTSSTDV